MSLISSSDIFSLFPNYQSTLIDEYHIAIRKVWTQFSGSDSWQYNWYLKKQKRIIFLGKCRQIAAGPNYFNTIDPIMKINDENRLVVDASGRYLSHANWPRVAKGQLREGSEVMGQRLRYLPHFPLPGEFRHWVTIISIIFEELHWVVYQFQSNLNKHFRIIFF